jgi:hypothetical protein
MSMTREQILRQDQALRAYQERADDALSTWGMRAPAPKLSANPEYGEEYRRELAYLAKQRLREDDELRKFKVLSKKRCPLDVFEVAEPQIYARCKATGASNDSASSGELREVTRINPHNGYKEQVFLGKESFIKFPNFDCKFPGNGGYRRGRQVVSFMHRFNTSGVAFR